ncbi:hypothetical protein [Streptomyces anulatus]|nr:hypothetical protein OG536_04645 [Streptomyces anulatus]
MQAGTGGTTMRPATGGVAVQAAGTGGATVRPGSGTSMRAGTGGVTA